MSDRSFLIDEPLGQYLDAHNPSVDEVSQELINATQVLGSVSGMQISANQGALLTLLAKSLDVHEAVEVGTFTGFSSMCIARGMSEPAHLICCDISEEWTSIARSHWRKAGVENRIDLRIAPALETLRSLPSEPHLDFAFIDADKPGYISYYDELVTRLKPRGLIAADNVLWSGKVVDQADTDENTVAIRAFNDHVAADRRVTAVIVPIGDGVTLISRNS